MNHPDSQLRTTPFGAEAFTQEETYAELRRPVGFAQTLVREAYTSDEFFALERERVFRSGWVAVGLLDRVRNAGDVLVADVGGRSIFVVRNRDGELRGFYNVCRHRGTALLREGECRVGRFVRCPYHGWAYDLDGKCLGTPLFTYEIPDDQRPAFDMGEDAEFDKADFGLLTVPVDTWGPLVFASLDPEPGDLHEHLGDLPERTAGYRLDEWTLADTRQYDIAGNWKLIAENFEWYHLPWVHPELNRLSPVDAHYHWQGPGMYLGGCVELQDDGWNNKDLPPIEGLSDEDLRFSRFGYVFPNAGLVISPNSVWILFVDPVSPHRTIETTWLLTHPESASTPAAQVEVEKLATFLDTVNKEDVDIIERVHAGLDGTPFPGGRMCYRFEAMIHRFQNMIADRMVGRHHIPPGYGDGTVPMFPSAEPAASGSSDR